MMKRKSVSFTVIFLSFVTLVGGRAVFAENQDEFVSEGAWEDFSDVAEDEFSDFESSDDFTGELNGNNETNNLVDADSDQEIEINSENFPDKNFRNYLEVWEIDKDGDNYLSIDEIQAATYLELDNEKITDLTGIEYFTNLENLDCAENQITDLDISKNTKLTSLYCKSNNLKKLDLTNNTALKFLDCSYNQLENVNFSVNQELESLYCSGNKIKTLDLSNNTNLQRLGCSSNEVRNLDLSANGKLVSVSCGDNGMESLNITSNTMLQELFCNNNKLKKLDVTHNQMLGHLECDGNELEELDVTQNTNLYDLLCKRNKITKLDLSNNPRLGGLWCQDNRLLTLDLSNNPEICYIISLPENGWDEMDEHRKYKQSSSVVANYANNNWYINLEELIGKDNIKNVEELGKSTNTTNPTDGKQSVKLKNGVVLLGSKTEGEFLHFYYETGFTGSCFKSIKLEVSLQIVYADSTEKVNCNHDWEDVVEKNATCTENGFSYRKCTICGEKETNSEKTIPAAGHKYGDYKVTKAATIFEAGTETRECSVCKAQDSREIPKLASSVTLTTTSLPVQVKKSVSASALIANMESGDSIASLKTSNAKVAAVNNSTFKITAKKAGKATITVTLKSGASANITVNVKKGKVAATKITGIKKTVTLKKGKKLTLKPVLSPITCTEKVTYTSSNKKVATVSAKGVVKALKKGKATIKVKAGKKTVTCKVTVK